MRNMVGDVVVLNSGGAPMTIVRVDGSRVECAWMDQDGMFDTAWLPVSCLRVVEG